MFDILGTLPSVNPRVQQPCLQFTYWSVVFMEQTMQGSQVFRDSSCYTTLCEMRTRAYLCEMRVLAHFVCAFSRVDLLVCHCTRGVWFHHPFFILTRVQFYLSIPKRNVIRQMKTSPATFCPGLLSFRFITDEYCFVSLSTASDLVDPHYMP